jgi:hypothetical protein
MNENYLWDRSGDVDTEVRELEDLLGTLKYQPRPLQIPSTLRAGRKRSVISLAIAAAIALLMIGAGLWLHFGGLHNQPPMQAKDDPSVPALNQTPPTLPGDQIAISTIPPRLINSGPAHKPKPRLARNNIQPVRNTPQPLTEQERAERDQVLIGLRLASVKLNLAQRKMQTLPPANTFRN